MAHTAQEVDWTWGDWDDEQCPRCCPEAWEDFPGTPGDEDWDPNSGEPHPISVWEECEDCDRKYLSHWHDRCPFCGCPKNPFEDEDRYMEELQITEQYT